jgi:hypothetical protein
VINRCTRLLCLLTVLAVTGCIYPRAGLRPPGPVQYQRQNASLHDPYADNDLGPEVVGGRPRDFQKPLAEPVRSRSVAESWWAAGR